MPFLSRHLPCHATDVKEDAPVPVPQPQTSRSPPRRSRSLPTGAACSSLRLLAPVRPPARRHSASRTRCTTMTRCARQRRTERGRGRGSRRMGSSRTGSTSGRDEDRACRGSCTSRHATPAGGTRPTTPSRPTPTTSRTAPTRARPCPAAAQAPQRTTTRRGTLRRLGARSGRVRRGGGGG